MKKLIFICCGSDLNILSVKINGEEINYASSGSNSKMLPLNKYNVRR